MVSRDYFREGKFWVSFLWLQKLLLVSFKVYCGHCPGPKIIRENAFEQKKLKPGLSANRPSNNLACEQALLFG